MSKIPAKALIQKNPNGTEYVYFPSYYYDKDSKTKNKEKQKRLYIGKLVNGEFKPNKLYLSRPDLQRRDAAKDRIELLQEKPRARAKAERQETYTQKSYGSIALLKALADKHQLTADLEEVYGHDAALEILSLAYFMILDGNSSFYLYPRWARRFEVPCGRYMDSPKISELLDKLGEKKMDLMDFFKLRAKHVGAKEHLSYDSTKLGSEAGDIFDVRWAPSKAGDFRKEIGLAILCGQTSRLPVMYRVLPGNMADVKTVRDLMCRWDEIGISKEATAVFDRGYNSALNLDDLINQKVNFVMGQKSGVKFVEECLDENMHKFWESKYFLGDYNLYGVAVPKEITVKKGNERVKHKVWVHMFRGEKANFVAMRAMEKKLRDYEALWLAGKADKSSDMYACFYPQDEQGSSLERNHAVIDQRIRFTGFFSFVSNYIKDPAEVLAIYRGRDSIEKTFRVLQSDLDVVSTGVHHDSTLNGKLLICFVALTMMAALNYAMEKPTKVEGKAYDRLYDSYTLNELLYELNCISKITTLKDGDRLTEITGPQQLIYKRVGVPVPAIEKDSL